MARPLRIEYEGAFYHVTSRGNDRQAVFLTERDYARFTEYLAAAKEKYGCLVHALATYFHVLKYSTALTNRELGQLFGGVGPSAIAHAARRVGARLRGTQRFDAIVRSMLSQVKG